MSSNILKAEYSSYVVMFLALNLIPSELGYIFIYRQVVYRISTTPFINPTS